MAAIAMSLTLFANPSQAYAPNIDAAVDCLTQNIYFEARGEPMIGQIAVGYVTLNRIKHPEFPDTVCDVVRERTKRTCQFSWYCDGRSDNLPNNAQVDNIRVLAYAILSNQFDDPTNGALFFHTTRLGYNKSENVVEIGNHVFYRGN